MNDDECRNVSTPHRAASMSSEKLGGGKLDPEMFDVAKTDKAVRGALRRRSR